MADITGMLQAAAGAGGEEAGYQISRSLRFNSADTAYLSRTPASAGNRKTWTFSAWVKRSGLGTLTKIFSAGTASSAFTFVETTTSNKIIFGYFSGSSVTWSFETSQVFRDPSAWYHLVIVLDTTQATNTNRIKIYVNGTEISGTVTYPAQDALSDVNNTLVHQIGNGVYNSTEPFNGYLTEINFVDGQALTADDFGETDATTGVWVPKAYAGTYGTNGFYLPFSDNTSTTTLGEDQAGSNDWTLNNFSVAAGAGNDSLVDTPTPYGTDTGAGGEVRGNYSTLNPLATISDTVSNGNLEWVGGLALNRITKSSIGVTTGKWYAEFTYTGTNNGSLLGICPVNILASGGAPTEGYAYVQNGNKYVISTSSAYGATWTTNDVIGIAVDLDADEITFYKNNSSQGAISITTAGPFCFFCIGSNTNDKGIWNFGQRPFAYTAPSGFKALCTQNLPDPTIVQGDDYFNTVTYTGNGSTQTISGVGFQPDFVWIKNRSGANSHQLSDAVRGFTKYLFSDATLAEETRTNQITSVNSDGFALDSNAAVNTNTNAYVAWNWNAGGSNATNTDGTITSTVRANTTAGFSIVSYTGTGSAATVGHGLSAAPAMIIVKNRDQTDAWQVYHKANTAAPETDYLVLNTTAATADAADRWNDTAPTSSVFSIGNGVEVNTNTEDYIAYVFAEVEGYSKFGGYTGNGSTDGPFVYANHRPAFIMVKRTDSTSNWTIIDTKREGYNVDNDPLYPNLSNAEGTTDLADILSNGFKLRSTDASVNASGGTYIFMSLASNPFKYSLGR